MDKTVFKVTSIRDKGDYASYWIKKSYIERIAALEQLRKVMFGYDPSTARLQRTLTITKLKKDLKRNKKASGRHKDLADIENLEV